MGKSRRWSFAFLICGAWACGARSALFTDDSFDDASDLYVGSSIGTADGPLSSLPADQQGFFVGEFDATGALVWSKTFGAARDDVNGVAVDHCGLGLFTRGFLYGDATCPRADGGADITVHAEDAGARSTMLLTRLAR